MVVRHQEQGPHCKAWPRHPHRATRRTGYCEKHHAEYQTAMQRYRNAVYNFTHGRTSKEPPTRADFIRRIRFSKPSTDVQTVLTPREKKQLVTAMNDLSSVPVLLGRLAETGQAPSELFPQTWLSKLTEAQMAVNRAMMLIARVTGMT